MSTNTYNYVRVPINLIRTSNTLLNNQYPFSKRAIRKNTYIDKHLNNSQHHCSSNVGLIHVTSLPNFNLLTYPSIFLALVFILAMSRLQFLVLHLNFLAAMIFWILTFDSLSP